MIIMAVVTSCIVGELEGSNTKLRKGFDMIIGLMVFVWGLNGLDLWLYICIHEILQRLCRSAEVAFTPH